MNSRNEKFKKLNVSNIVSILSIVILTLIFALINSNFIAGDNIYNILTDISPLLVMSTGVTFILLLGCTDLSVGAVCSLSAVLFAKFAPDLGVFTYVLVLAFGAFSGLILSLLYTKLKVPTFIASLGIMSVWQSIALLMSGSGPIQLKPAQWYLIDWVDIKIGFIPSMFIVALVIAALYFVLQRFTILGRQIYATGANERGARLSGVPCDKVKIISYVLSGMCYAFAGAMYTAKLTSGSPNLGDDFTLLAIASVALGGTALSGGKGSIVGTVLGVSIVTIIRNGMNVIGIDPFWQKIVFGIIVIGAAYMTANRSDKELVVK